MLHKSFTPNKNAVEIELVSFCNLNCLNCDRSCRQAPSKEYMSLEQTKKFVDESIKLNWDWKYIGLLGGEPTLHPELFDILKIIKKYKDFNPESDIQIVTNGYGDQVNGILSDLPEWIHIRNENKKDSVQLFSSYNVAPTDLKEYKNVDFSTGCSVTQSCGLGLTRYGYYPCGAGASVDRIFGFDIGIKKLSEIDNLKLKTQSKLLCSYCGHFKDTPGNSSKKNWIKKERISQTWKEAYENYKKKKPKLTLY
ncbi:radical SAM protein [Candidatus Woesearchaeota archaeon]|nr:radical SAM protein [Candidatus Woesearchaeota archaeon]